MRLACLDCLCAVQSRLDEQKRAQGKLLDETNGNSLQQCQYFEGQIVALEFVQKVLNKALNRETSHATPASPAPLPHPDGVPPGAGEANGLGR